MAKKIKAYIKLQITGGAANPSPPVGPALGQQGVNIMEFCDRLQGEIKEKPMICQITGHTTTNC